VVVLAAVLFALSPEPTSDPAPAAEVIATDASATDAGATSAEHPSTGDAFSDWQIALTTAVERVHDDPAAGAPTLAAILAEAEVHTVHLANDDAARARRNAALLSLSRAYAGLGDTPAAEAAMDEALRAAGNDPLPAEAYGPTLAQVHAGRRAALIGAGRGALIVECATPCRVYLDERPAPAHARGLLLGPYRLHVEATDPAVPPLHQEILVGQADQEVHISFPASATAEGPSQGDAPAIESRPTKRRRIAPRWFEALAVAGGAAAMGAGGALLVLDDRCVGDPTFEPSAMAPGTCADIFNTRTGGFVALGAGAFFFVGGLVTLAVDESRVRRSGVRVDASKSALSLGYTLRF